ncbi:flagellar motor protein MotB [Pseudoxanthomonas suwonensis]|uniref:Flagellar motor protein MotB n=1 Tax=Pseudoxanthomonas suwonensis TaxID=314722 RepID=A0A0E3UPR0_9GAMM|nr:flagellar motor protein MotB [Pseudoxanthomonas suwonensis]AKC88035.1 flagellar motor protein MotB [Pseudoxanthomonas suwonensis]
MEQKQPIIIRRVKKVAGGHHGGAWKVAYADFVTAMMAFFLVMWLVGIASKEQKAAVSEYFKNPSAVEGSAAIPGSSSLGPGGASDKLIPTANALSMPGGIGPKVGDPGEATRSRIPSEEAARAAAAEDRRQLDELRRDLEAAIEKSLALAPFKDQLLIDLTPEGLRIQIVDRLNRPMFDLGSARMKDYTAEVMHELGALLTDTPHRIALAGHTDETPFQAPRGYGNWELSSDRANAARRALLEGGLDEARIARVVGLASSVPFDRDDPRAPINRRISLVVLNRAADAAPDALASVPPPLPDAAPATVAVAPAFPAPLHAGHD